MKSKFKKRLLLVVPIVLSCLLFGFIVKQETAKPKVTSEMFELLPNGESKRMSGSTLDEADVEMIREKENKLKSLIAQQTKLDKEDINVVVTLGSISKIDGKASQDITCSIVLNTDAIFEKQIIQNIVEDLKNVFKQDSVELNVKKENIMITNSNNIVLY